MQDPYDPGNLPSCTNACILVKVCLRSNLQRKCMYYGTLLHEYQQLDYYTLIEMI